MIRALDRKLLRESWHLRSQMLSIALVVACGIMAAGAAAFAVRRRLDRLNLIEVLKRRE